MRTRYQGSSQPCSEALSPVLVIGGVCRSGSACSTGFSGRLQPVNVNLVPDDLWDRIAPLLPVRPRRHRHPGRPPVPDRVALAGIVHVLRKGVAWRDVPSEVVGCSLGDGLALSAGLE
ncbi:transposase [Streptomyces sp. bgisy022]|uniref:transposase n=1 Tax=Streptomyces sp. bgisy022 TaxID=3413769 RepID=UPI003D75CEBD